MGASDLKSEMMLVPRAMALLVRPGRRQDRRGVEEPIWLCRRQRGRPPYATDGMNEAGLTVGVLFFPGFAKYQEVKTDELRDDGQQCRSRQLHPEQLQDCG